MKPLPSFSPQILQIAQCAVCTWADRCANLGERLALPNTTTWFTETVSSGTLLAFPDNHPTCNRLRQTVKTDFCRVAMSVTTSPTSNISLEAWLPFNWTGRFLSTGNGGLGGCIQYEDMAYAVKNGFATVGANGGHNGTSGIAFYKNTGAIEDFAYRSVHTGVVIGKQVTEAFYGQEHTKSYFLGCSAGGRQGFKSAQDFPDDFDGIVAGAPAFAFNNLSSWRGHFLPITGAPGAPSYLPPDLWSVVQQDVMRQCDGLDGFADGIIEDPNLCQYRPEALICNSSQSEDCLTKAQANTVRAVFSPLRSNGSYLVYPRLQPGVPYGPLVSGQPFQYSVDWFRYAIHNDPTWDPATIGKEDFEAAWQSNLFNIDTWEGDLSGAMSRGTKILHYHGLQDTKISSDNSMRYYIHVLRTMRVKPETLDDFYRYFRISGLDHCSGGPGATFIGNSEDTVHEDGPEGNVLSAMIKWVEEGIAPESILGAAYVNGSKNSGKVAFQRRHCKYPLRNMYDGVGDPRLPDSWKCV
ncbi:tannase and feruloyl esterase [Thelonectria olida]|uniref:Carboxylic ester hydrolase n=1 Tax=Thelonectria olida TaxID=1576542 RepID=A0A9P8WJ54_9HYPO|nr:tannase and feruloyl esterase [Thelonectria olida]